MKQQNIKNLIIDFFESYGPIVVSFIILIVIIGCFNNFYKSKYFTDALTSCIMIVSIFTGTYSAIMPVIFGIKNKNMLYKKVLENKRYKRYLIFAIISGFICIVISFLLYFSDLYEPVCSYNLPQVIISDIWVFFLGYFLLSNIRVAVVTIYMILSSDEDDKLYKDDEIEQNKMNAIECYKKSNNEEKES